MNNSEKCKNEVMRLLQSGKLREMLTEEAILKIKLATTDYTLEEATAGVKAALAQLGSSLEIRISSSKKYYRVLDKFGKDWIIANSLEELRRYNHGEITIRGLHYRLVARGMTNSHTHYGRVKSAMVSARREGLVAYTQFADHERETIGDTPAEPTDVDSSVDSAESAIESWLTLYYKNRWENQPIYPEVWIEKKALIGVFDRLCSRNRVLLSPCKGYPSLTFLKEAADRFEEHIERGKSAVILYFGDYDASGEDIPRSIQDNLYDDFGVQVEVRRVLLMEQQVIEMGLPPAPTKAGDSRGNNWTGLGQVELDAVDPKVVQRFCQEAIDQVRDDDLLRELRETEREERAEYVGRLRSFVENYEFDDE